MIVATLAAMPRVIDVFIIRFLIHHYLVERRTYHDYHICVGIIYFGVVIRIGSLRDIHFLLQSWLLNNKRWAIGGLSSCLVK